MSFLDRTPDIKTKHLVLYTAAVCATLLVMTVIAAKAQTVALRLKPIVTVEGDMVRIGDLFEGAGRYADIAVFGAPKPGASGMISTARIRSAVRDNDISEIDTNGLTSVTVRRTGRRINAEEINKAVTAALVKDHQIAKDSEIELNSGQLELTVETSAIEPVQVRNLSYNGTSGRFEATFVVPGSRALELTPAAVTGTVADIVRAPVLTRAVLKGDVITAADLSLERRRRSDLGQDVVSDADKLIGNSARRALPKGLVLREADIQRPELVERNANIIMLHEQPGLQLSMRGKALQAGALGDTIQVQNISSKKIVEAIVTGPGRVKVTGVVMPQKSARNGADIQ
jgi:flagellar basal body P-ring formation protein FlgA